MLTSEPPFFSADVSNKKCALIGLHLILRSEEETVMDVTSPGLRDEWKMGCPKSPMWESEGEAWSEDENASSSGPREGNVCNDALHVIGLWAWQDLSFLAGLGAGKGGIELPHGPGHAVPGNEWALGSWSAAAARKAFLSPWTGCDKNGEGCGEKMKEKERERRALFLCATERIFNALI